MVVVAADIGRDDIVLLGVARAIDPCVGAEHRSCSQREGNSLSLNAGDLDFRSPTTPKIVNLISALRTLKSRFGSDFILSMAPETFYVQVGFRLARASVARANLD